MSYVFLLSPTQMSKIELFFPRSHGVPRVDDRRIILGIVYVIKHVLQWKDAPRDTLMIDATHLKAHRTACSLLKGGTSPTYRAYKRIGGVTKRDKRFLPDNEHQAACGLRWRKSPAGYVPDGWPDLRPFRPFRPCRREDPLSRTAGRHRGDYDRGQGLCSDE